MLKHDRSLAMRFLIWWTVAVGLSIALCSALYYFFERSAQLDRLKQDTLTLAAVVAPRVTHDLEMHVASYAHRTLRSIQSKDKAISLGIYASNGAILFSTNPVFRRGKEVPTEVSQAISDRKERWSYSPAEYRCQVFFPLISHKEVVGVLQITRSTEDLLLVPLRRTALLAFLCSVIALIASGFLLLFLRRYYFKPLKALNAMLERFCQPLSSPGLLEIPEGEFHGELAALYRHAGQLTKGMADARKTLESRVEVKNAVEKIQEETRFLARQSYERKIDRFESFPGYEILCKPVQMEHWGKLWKNATAQGARKVVFSFWNNKNEGLKGTLQGFQWDELLADLAQRGKNLEEISDELFMEFGLDLGEWLLGSWDAYDRRLELMGNVWACHWDHAKENFSYLKNAKPLVGSRKQGFWANWSFGPADKLIVFNAEAFEAPGGAGLETFVGHLSKNIKSTPQNLLDLLLRELDERRLLAPDASLLLMIHSATQAADKLSLRGNEATEAIR